MLNKIFPNLSHLQLHYTKNNYKTNYEENSSEYEYDKERLHHTDTWPAKRKTSNGHHNKSNKLILNANGPVKEIDHQPIYQLHNNSRSHNRQISNDTKSNRLRSRYK